MPLNDFMTGSECISWCTEQFSFADKIAMWLVWLLMVMAVFIFILSWQLLKWKKESRWWENAYNDKGKSNESKVRDSGGHPLGDTEKASVPELQEKAEHNPNNPDT